MNLCVSGIQFAYNGTLVLSDVGFSLEQGQIMCILGVNGAGKSTLLKCINRVLKPQYGSVLINGEEALSMERREVARRIGYVPQSQSDIEMSVFESVLMGRKPHMRWSMTQEDYRIAEGIIFRIGIEHLAMRNLCELSGGEKQKVAIARALAQSPKILLLDEPTSNLDLKGKIEVMDLVRSLVDEQGLSVIIAIHDLNMAVRFSDRLLFLKNHKIVSITSPHELDTEIIRDVYEVDVALRDVCGHTVIVPL